MMSSLGIRPISLLRYFSTSMRDTKKLKFPQPILTEIQEGIIKLQSVGTITIPPKKPQLILLLKC